MPRITGRTPVATALLLLPLACAGRGAPASSPAPSTDEDRLLGALSEPRTGRQIEVVDSIGDAIGGGFLHLLEAFVADDTLPAMARANALLVLGERHASTRFRAFWLGTAAAEPQVRAAALVGLRGVLAQRERAALGLIREALRDPDVQVRIRALETLGDADPDVLRTYLAGGPTAELAAIARELLQVAEERGAPLVDSRSAAAAGDAANLPASDGGSDGAAGPVLARETVHGHRLVFRARRGWEQWDVWVGDLVLRARGGAPVVVSDGVEAVARVVPAFFSVDGRFLIYEAGREIRVRNVETGEERRVGAGVAPRAVPFGRDFVYLVERVGERASDGQATALVYDVLLASFTDGEPRVIGTLEAGASMARHGNASPVRWMRVRDRDGRFFLEGDDMTPFELPDPFDSPAARP